MGGFVAPLLPSSDFRRASPLLRRPGALRAFARPSREEFLKINIRNMRGGERRGCEATKNYSISCSPRPLLLFPPLPFFSLTHPPVFLPFSFFSRYPPAKRIVRSRPPFLKLTSRTNKGGDRGGTSEEDEEKAGGLIGFKEEGPASGGSRARSHGGKG